MTILDNYGEFHGYHWETGTLRNYFAYRGERAPHSGEPWSEALFMGVSGGAVVGYFTFAYEGYDPQCNILTRNTFDPLQTLLSRLGVVQEVAQTTSPKKARQNLIDALEEGTPAIVWADLWSLPYTPGQGDEGTWGAMPILIYGYDEEKDVVHIADRSQRSLQSSVAEMEAARGRVKRLKHRVLTMDAPNPEKLRSAVQMGIQDCIKLYTEKPPKGAKHNFGLAALRHWARMLTEPKQRSSWNKIFPLGPKLYAGLTSAYYFAFLFGKDLSGDAERGLYATFLREAAQILEKPAIEDAADAFDAVSKIWQKLPEKLLPERVEPLAQARKLMTLQHRTFLEEGAENMEKLEENEQALNSLRESMEEGFPLDESEATQLKEEVAQMLLEIHDGEERAVELLRQAALDG